MEPSEIYSTCRHRLVAASPLLTIEQLAVALPATPPWTVLDAYRHLAGVCADVLDGVIEGAGSPAWTAVQVTSRQGQSIDDVCEEWAGRGPELDARIAAAGNTMAFIAFDAWTHSQDVHAAVGLEARRDEAMVSSLAALALATLGRRYVSKGGPPLKVVVDGQATILGEGDPTVTLDTTAYELLRIIFGRRSKAQVEAAMWSGAESPAALEAIHLFDFPVVDIID